MHPMIADKRAEIVELCRRYGVTRLELFGSAARGGDFDVAHSDADFLVEFGPESDLSALERYQGLAEALTAVLGRPVDLVEPRAVTNPYIRAGIDRSREIVFG